MKKMVRFTKRELLYPRFAGSMGPIGTPSMVGVRDIEVFLIKGLKVEEELSDGTFIELTMDNYNTDNTPVEPEPPAEPDPV